ncbi:MAG: LamG-like jellyroll fold domain-containing protein, partial [Ignavibacterium sp.]
RFGVNNKAYQFDGVNDYINVTNSNSITITDEITISVWVRRTRYNAIDMIMEKGGDWTTGSTNYGLALHYLNNNMYYFFFNGGWRGTSGVSDFEWHHYAAVIKNGDANPKLYIDGVLKPIQFQDGAAQISLYPSTSNLNIGAQLGTYTYFSANIIDDIRIYNRNLSDDEITLLYNDSTTYLPPLEDGLVAYWPFDGNTVDSTSSNNDGINFNGVFDKDRYGYDNSSIYFDGVDSYVEGINPGNNLPIGNSPRSFTAWIKNNQYNQYGSNIFHYGTAQTAPTNFHFLITDVLGLGNGYGFGIVYGNTNLVDSTWHFVTGVYEGGTERITKLFIDGKLDAIGTISTEPNTILGTNWRIGRFMQANTNFNGNIDELKVYDIPLTDQQIRDMYKATTTAPNLVFPANNSTINTLTPVMDWDSLLTATNYLLQISTDSLFSAIILSQFSDQSSYTINTGDLNANVDYYWRVRTNNDGGVGPWSEINRFNIILTDVENEQQLPTEFALIQNYPNPFNPATTISWQSPISGWQTLKVYDVLGNEVATLVDEFKPAGKFEVEFASDNLSSGIYYYQLKIVGNSIEPSDGKSEKGFTETKKMIIIK